MPAEGDGGAVEARGTARNVRALATALVVCALTTGLVVAFTGPKSVAAAQAVVSVSPVGDDARCARGNRSSACATFNKAYSLARCGDSVEVDAGNYPKQQIDEVAALSGCSSNVTIQPVSGAVVTVDGIDLGTVAGGQTTNAPDRLTIKGFRMPDGIGMYGDATDIIVDAVDGGAFFIAGGRRVTVKNSDWGPCNSSGDTNCETFFSRQIVIENSDATSDIVIENNRIHDFLLTGANDHFECIRTDGGTNVTVRGNRFWNCEIYAMTITNPAGSWVIENNFFGRTSCCATTPPQADRSSSIVLGDATSGARVAIRNNNFGVNQTVVSEGATGFGSVSIVGNILDSRQCVPDVTYASNLFVTYDATTRAFVGGKGCSASNRTAIYGYMYDGERLRPDGVKAVAVRNAFAGVASGLSSPKLRALLRRVAPPPPGGWTMAAIAELTKDPTYLGGRVGIRAAHPPLVNLARWKAVQAKWRAAGKKNPPKR